MVQKLTFKDMAQTLINAKEYLPEQATQDPAWSKFVTAVNGRNKAVLPL